MSTCVRIVYSTLVDPCSSDYSDCTWSMYSFSKRAHNFLDKQVVISSLSIRNKLRAGTAFLIRCQLGDGNYALMRNYRDILDADGIMIWGHKITDIGAKTADDRACDAEHTLRLYNDYVNNEGHGFSMYECMANDFDDHYMCYSVGRHIDHCYGLFDSEWEHTADMIIESHEGGPIIIHEDNGMGMLAHNISKRIRELSLKRFERLPVNMMPTALQVLSNIYTPAFTYGRLSGVI